MEVVDRLKVDCQEYLPFKSIKKESCETVKKEKEFNYLIQDLVINPKELSAFINTEEYKEIDIKMRIERVDEISLITHYKTVEKNSVEEILQSEINYIIQDCMIVDDKPIHYLYDEYQSIEYNNTNNSSLAQYVQENINMNKMIFSGLNDNEERINLFKTDTVECDINIQCTLNKQRDIDSLLFGLSLQNYQKQELKQLPLNCSSQCSDSLVSLKRNIF